MIPFKNPALLTTALTHRSVLNERAGVKISNERLEFLGDAVLELVVSDYLYSHHPKESEGKLTQMRAALVQTKTLAQVAKNLNLGQMMFLSSGEKASGGQNNPSLLADCFEAVTGAIFLDQGLSAAAKFIVKNLLKPSQTLLQQIQITDYKSQLQELWQKNNQATPVYKIISATGPEHKKKFTVKVYLNHRAMGQGSGLSKQAAQQQAAKSAIIKNNYA